MRHSTDLLLQYKAYMEVLWIVICSRWWPEFLQSKGFEVGLTPLLDHFDAVRGFSILLECYFFFSYNFIDRRKYCIFQNLQTKELILSSSSMKINSVFSPVEEKHYPFFLEMNQIWYMTFSMTILRGKYSNCFVKIVLKTP